ncbi:hypothetical protein HK103_001735 [Boothiomyces macroporosus]|uniref:Uncharacterized protein n=1 Tax=Boothiomyces macroporosus TaxID=261099 RepID=A0AAD5Y516_9FUNG|nr:hypothetical protein HK103_001735 [Boothiomyces macroporosus]
MNTISKNTTLVNLFQKEVKLDKTTEEKAHIRNKDTEKDIDQRNNSEISLYNDSNSLEYDNTRMNTIDTKAQGVGEKKKRITIVTPQNSTNNKDKGSAATLKCRIFSAFQRIPNPALFKVNSYYNNDICTLESKKPKIKARKDTNLESNQNKIAFIDVGNTFGLNKLSVTKTTKHTPKAIHPNKSYGKKRRGGTVGQILNSSNALAEKYQVVKSLYGIYNTAVPVNSFNNLLPEVTDVGDSKEQNILHLQTLDLNLPPENCPKKIVNSVNLLLHKTNTKSSLSLKEAKRPDTTHSITLQLQLPYDNSCKKLKLPAMKEPLVKSKTMPNLDSTNSKATMAEILSTILPPTLERADRIRKNIQKKKQAEGTKQTHAFLIAESAIANKKFENIQTIQLDLINPEKPGKSEFKAVESVKTKSDPVSKLPPLKSNHELVPQKTLNLIRPSTKGGNNTSPLPRKQNGKKQGIINSIFWETEYEDLNGEFIDIGPWNK